jgi:cyclic beta-1,2-glucan synthetase
MGNGGHERRPRQRRTVWGFTSAMIASPVTAVLSLLTVAAVRPEAVPDALPFVLAWVTAPFVAHALSQPAAAAPRALADDDRAWLREVARDTWRYFEHYATDEHHALPPDNVQFEPDERVAARTSPTNIGMGLLSTLAAHDLGFITTPVLADRLDATLTTVEQLEKVNGHLLNWYDTRSLAPLRPAYVSTVDSGNLAGALLTLASGLEGLAAVGLAGDPVSQRLAALAARALRIVDDTDFAFLFDTKRELFAVGYRVADEEGPGRLDPSYYDLLASESRLASFIAIARGDVPQPLVPTGRRSRCCRAAGAALGRTMFECDAGSSCAYPETRDRIVPGNRENIDYGEQNTRGASRVRLRGRGSPAPINTAPSACRASASNAASASIASSPRTPARWPSWSLPKPPARTCGASRAKASSARTASSKRSTTPRRAGTWRPAAHRRRRRASYEPPQGMSLVAIGNALLGDLMVDRFHRLPLVRATDLLLRAGAAAAGRLGASDDDAPVPAPRPPCRHAATARRTAGAARATPLERAGWWRSCGGGGASA